MARTGLTPDLLRAWQRRYRVVEPARTTGGHRLYSDADIERLRLLYKATRGGRPIRTVARLPNESLEKLAAADDAAFASKAPPLPAAEVTVIAALHGEAMSAVVALDPIGLERVLHRAEARLAITVLIDRLLAPLLWEIGDRWAAGELTPMYEHLASAEIHRVLSRLVDRTRLGVDAPTLVVATPAGQLVELGAMLVAATAAAEGWHVAHFGSDLPATEIAAAAERLGARAVAISVCHEAKDVKLVKELERLAKLLPPGTALLAGGRAAQSRALLLGRIGATVFADVESFRVWLRGAMPALS